MIRVQKAPLPAVVLALTFLACATERIQLGTGVLNIPYRLPFQLDKQVAMLQELSGGRLRFGVGTGWNETEFQALGVPYRERGKRTDAALALLHRDRGKPHDFPPPTPPGIRVRTRAVRLS